MSYRPPAPSQEPDATRTSNSAFDVGPTGQKEPFIKKRDTWHTFALPPGAPPRQGFVGFIKYVVAVTR